MNSQDPHSAAPEPKVPGHEPVFNLPGVVLAMLLVMLAAQVGIDVLLDPRALYEIYVQAAFIPQRYAHDPSGQDWAYFWSPVSYSLLHGGYAHLVLNAFWLAAFGSVVARRIGALRFLTFWIFSAAAAAAMFLVFHWSDQSVMIGASGVVSALMGAASRFAFGRETGFRRDLAHLNPRLSLVEALTNRMVVGFLAVWFGLNVLAAAGFSFGMADSAIAWEAHVGGFLFGFLGFGLFDVERRN